MQLGIPNDLKKYSKMFKAMGDEARLRVVGLLSHGELCVCHLEEALEMSQPTVSRHLAVLKNAGVVDSRREGNWVYYRLSELPGPFRALVREFSSQPALKRTVKRVIRLRGPGQCR